MKKRNLTFLLPLSLHLSKFKQKDYFVTADYSTNFMLLSATFKTEYFGNKRFPFRVHTRNQALRTWF